MAWPPGKHFETIISKAKQTFGAISIDHYEIGDSHGVLDLEGRW